MPGTTKAAAAACCMLAGLLLLLAAAPGQARSMLQSSGRRPNAAILPPLACNMERMSCI